MEKKTVLITGGSSGIGAAMVTLFAENGYAVWFTYNTGAQRAGRLVDSLENKHIESFQLDLGNRESHSRLLSSLPGKVDILINNAGLGSKTVEKISSDMHGQDALLLSVNALGPLWLARDIIPSMLERGSGKIIFISSVGGGVTQFPSFHPADGMSKAAVAYLGRHLQAKYSNEPLDIFTICPGATETPMFEASTLNGLDAKTRQRLVESLPGGRLIKPVEIARLALFLCTEEARVLRGAVIDASLGLGVHPGALTGGDK